MKTTTTTPTTTTTDTTSNLPYYIHHWNTRPHHTHCTTTRDWMPPSFTPKFLVLSITTDCTQIALKLHIDCHHTPLLATCHYFFFWSYGWELRVGHGTLKLDWYLLRNGNWNRTGVLWCPFLFDIRARHVRAFELDFLAQPSPSARLFASSAAFVR